MFRFTPKFVLAGLTMAGLLSAAFAPGATRAATPRDATVPVALGVANPDEGRECHGLVVHLNGTQPVALYCPEKHVPPTSPASLGAGMRSPLLGSLGRLVQPGAKPAITTPGNSVCNSNQNWIHLWEDANQQNNFLCVYGSAGFGVYLNLSTIPGPGIGTSWNDRATSWVIAQGPCTGHFYVNDSGGGTYQTFSNNPSNSSTGTYGGNFGSTANSLPNDSLSSIGYIATGNCGG